MRDTSAPAPPEPTGWQAATLARDAKWDSASRVVLAVAALISYARLFLGVDVTDESFYNAAPYAFALGNTPYSDELNIAQNGAILLTPLFKLYHLAVGSSTGVVLFNRHLYFALLAGCGWLAYRVAAAHLNRPFARLLTAFTLTFSYFNIPSLSYNTLGAFFLFGGIFLLLLHMAPGVRRRRHLIVFAANTCFIATAFAHPSLLFAALAGLAASLTLAWRADPSHRAAWLASLGLGGLAALAFFAWIGQARLNDALTYARSYDFDIWASAPRSAMSIWNQLRHVGTVYFPGFAALLALSILPAGSFRNSRLLFSSVAPVMAATILYLLHRHPTLVYYPAGSAPLIQSFGGALLPLLLLLPDRKHAWQLAKVVALPCLVGTAILAFTSTNRLHATPITLFPAATCALLVVGLVAQTIDRDQASNRARMAAAMGVLVAIVAFQGVCLLERSYRDAPFEEGGPVFAPGPFAGILTNEPNARRLAAMRADLASLAAGGARTVFSYDDFPAGYLLSPLRPRTFSTWIFWPHDPAVGQKLLARVFDAANPPDVVLRTMPPLTYAVDYEMKRLNYKMHLMRTDLRYAVFVRDGATIPPSPVPLRHD